MIQLWPGAGKCHRDASGIGTRRNCEVVLELALVAVEDRIHPRVDLAVQHFSIGRDSRMPSFGIVADEIIHRAGEFIGS